jgi:iron-sulfur cluster repair protein YtfE (RIC family)
MYISFRAVDFLNELQNQELCNLNNLVAKVENIDMNQNSSIDDLKQILQKIICNYWANIMRKQRLDIQRDARFQKLLSISLEIFVMHQIHDSLYYLLSNLFDQQDSDIKNKIDHLINIGASLDHLGVIKSLAVSMPNSMVELGNNYLNNLILL